MHFWRKLESRITFRMCGCGCFDSSSNIESARTGSLHACWLGHFVTYSIGEGECNWVRRYKPSYHCICGDQLEQKNPKKPTENRNRCRGKETQIGEGHNTLSYIQWGGIMQLSEKGTLLGDSTSQATWDQRGKQKVQQVLEKRNPNRRRAQHFVIYSIQEKGEGVFPEMNLGREI